MKKLLLLLAAVGMLATACEVGGNTDDGGVTLPTGSIATIEQQSANINATLATLQTTKSAASATLASLKAQDEATRGNDNGNNGVKTMIAALEERVAALEAIISNLQGYNDEELAKAEDWVSATFATLEQQEALANELAEIKALLATINSVSTTALKEAIATSEASIKSWVNESLNGYCTIADMNAQIAALKLSSTEDDQILQKEIDSINLTLKNLKSDIEKSYKEAINEAIVNYSGIINTTIAREIAAVNDRISKEIANINSRLDDIEKRLDNVEALLEELMSSVNSLSYIGESSIETEMYFTPEGSNVELNYQISPKSAIANLEQIWKYAISVTAFAVKGSDIQDVDLPITSFKSSSKTGIITIIASADNFTNEQLTNADLNWMVTTSITNGVKEVSSSALYMGMSFWEPEVIVETPKDNEIYAASRRSFYSEHLSIGENEIDKISYDQKVGYFVITFKKPITTIPQHWLQIKDGDCGDYPFIAISLPNSVTTIEQDAFGELYNCQSITFGNNITSIGNYAYSYSLARINIKDLAAYCKINFQSAYASPFYNRDVDLYLNGEKVVDLHIPSDVTEIKNYAFFKAKSIENIYFSSTTPPTLGTYSLGDPNANPHPTIHIPEGCLDAYMSGNWPNVYKSWIEGVNDDVISDYLISLDSRTIVYTTTDGQKIDYNGNDAVASHTFSGKVGSIKYRNEPTEVSGFISCNTLLNVALPNSVKSIGDGAFMMCSNLKNITLEEGLTSIGIGAFAYTALESINIPNSVTSIGCNAFSETKFKSVRIPDSVTEIGDYAFSNYTLEAFYGKFASADNRCLVVNGELTAFAPANTTSCSVPDNVSSVNMYTFTYCNHLEAFYGKFASADNRYLTVNGTLAAVITKNVTSFTIPEGVTSIGGYAFMRDSDHELNNDHGGRNGITSITIPESVTSIDDFAFCYCTALSEIRCKAQTPPTIQSLRLSTLSDNFKIYVPHKSVAAYRAAAGWSSFGDCIVAYNYETGEVVSGTKILYTSSDGNIVTPYKTNVFGSTIISNTYSNGQGCIVLGDAITSIGESAFLDKTTLTSITIPAEITSLGDGAFTGCSSLTNITLPDKLEVINKETFKDCSSLENITISNNITKIMSDAFNGCNTLTKVYYNGDLSSWCKISFSNSAANPLINEGALYIGGNIVEDLIIPSDITEVQFASFRGCGSIKSIVFHDNVQTITRHAFNGCKSITTITIGSGVTSIGLQAFYACKKLKEVYCKPTTPPSSANKMFDGNASDRKIYVPTASVEAYKSAKYWSDYADYIEGYDF